MKMEVKLGRWNKMSINKPSDFNFQGRYTLRKMHNHWFIVDREYCCLLDDLGNNFKEAEKKLIEFKKDKGDRQWV